MRSWFCLEVEFVKIDFQKESNLLIKFERIHPPNIFLKLYYLENFALILFVFNSESTSKSKSKFVEPFEDSNKRKFDSAYILAFFIVTLIHNIIVTTMKKHLSLFIKWKKYIKPIKVEIEFVNLEFENELKMVHIGQTLTLEVKEELIALLKEFPSIWMVLWRHA